MIFNNQNDNNDMEIGIIKLITGDTIIGEVTDFTEEDVFLYKILKQITIQKVSDNGRILLSNIYVPWFDIEDDLSQTDDDIHPIKTDQVLAYKMVDDRLKDIYLQQISSPIQVKPTPQSNPDNNPFSDFDFDNRL